MNTESSNPPEKWALNDNVLSEIRHAVMNPLTVVIGYAQLLGSREDMDDEMKTQVSRILEQARECVRILEESTNGMDRSIESDSDIGGKDELERARIMIVDDQSVIRRLAHDVLGADFDVVEAPDADQAEELMSSGSFDLLLLDLNLEGDRNGRELYESVRESNPALARKVVFMSGGVVDRDLQEFLDDTGRVCLTKPFKITELRDTVDQVLARDS